MTADLADIWNSHINECIADGWGIDEDLRYAPAGPGQEPVPILDSNEARFYASWLRFHGYITKAHERWFYADIARAVEEQHDG